MHQYLSFLFIFLCYNFVETIFNIDLCTHVTKYMVILIKFQLFTYLLYSVVSVAHNGIFKPGLVWRLFIFFIFIIINHEMSICFKQSIFLESKRTTHHILKLVTQVHPHPFNIVSAGHSNGRRRRRQDSETLYIEYLVVIDYKNLERFV